MNNLFTFQDFAKEFKSIDDINKQIKLLNKKIDDLPKPAKFGNSLKLISNKFEVVKLKTNDGSLNMTYDGLKTLFDKYNNAIKRIKTDIQDLELKTKKYEQFFNFNSIKYFTSALSRNTVSMLYHTDGEFSFHY